MSARGRICRVLIVLLVFPVCAIAVLGATKSVGLFEVLSNLFVLIMIGWGGYGIVLRWFALPESFVVVGSDYVDIVHREHTTLDRRYPLCDLRKAEKVGLADLVRMSPRESVLAELIETRSEAKRCAACIDSLLAQAASSA